ncbi:putative toxin-antitoxin system, toxin component [Leptospira phage vB_LbrZ_5399-LE1]|uniref:Uncharacterized protein n=1 Tax=Leptospira inadai serovar Lyme TaxID=293084 RepID=A0ABX4YGF8_9LEPT|nr:hypothetical protein [Leptospira inadai]AGS80702.1 putative toxin-antitoxin system, toxin component [Leptospira phage vB_LbrZ_5399-LE1]PNV74343.1 hypothetical protein BES34_014250 [Leptospira inadai serovar Lyme]
MELGWNEVKNEELKTRHPGLSFELIEIEIEEGRFKVINKKNDPSQKVFVVQLPFGDRDNYPVFIPFVEDPDEDGSPRFFLKTFYPNRSFLGEWENF